LVQSRDFSLPFPVQQGINSSTEILLAIFLLFTTLSFLEYTIQLLFLMKQLQKNLNQKELLVYEKISKENNPYFSFIFGFSSTHSRAELLLAML
jgi:hypothetical protein